MLLYFATQNKNKIKEVQSMLSGNINIRDISSFNLKEDIPETGKTLEENALQKANYITEKYHVDCIADDTGLEVEELNWEPGVFSARYAGVPVNDSKNIAKLLLNLKDKKNRKARFRTVIVLHLNKCVYYFTGSINGSITTKERGVKGFGYDPVFIPEGYDITFAEMTLEEKNKISHRAQSVEKLVHFLESRITN